MKDWLSIMKSSVRPLDLKSSPKWSRQSGSNASRVANCDGPFPLVPFVLVDDDRPTLGTLGTPLLRGESDGVGVEECLCPPNMPPNNPCLWPPPDAPGAAPPKGVALVALLAFFSLSSIFFLKVFASFSSMKHKAAIQSSNSKVWKKVRS